MQSIPTSGATYQDPKSIPTRLSFPSTVLRGLSTMEPHLKTLPIRYQNSRTWSAVPQTRPQPIDFLRELSERYASAIPTRSLL